MLNPKVIFNFANLQSIRFYIGLMGLLGLIFVFDVFVYLQLSILVGVWITLALHMLLSAGGIYLTYRLASERGRRLMRSINSGLFNEPQFLSYATTFIAGGLLIIPGLINMIVGLIMIIPLVGVCVGRKLSSLINISWREMYEYLRFEKLEEE